MDVALSKRDFQTDTNAYRDNEIVTFNIAWRNWCDDYLKKIDVKMNNGQVYTKWIPQ